MTYSANTPLVSSGVLSADEIGMIFSGRGNNPSGLAAAIVAEADAAGINSDFLAMQVGDESGWWTSTYALQRNNPSGFGAIDSNPDAATYFDTIQQGVHVTAAHWLTYIYGDSNPLAGDDPRFTLVPTRNRGTIHTIGQIGNGVWASSTTYANTIINLLNQYAPSGPADAPPSPPPPPSDGTVVINGVHFIDIRDQLATNPNGGPGYKASGQRLGTIIHYSAVNYPLDRPILDILQSEANYHVNKDWSTSAPTPVAEGAAPPVPTEDWRGTPHALATINEPIGGPLYGDGLMYHISVDPQTGQAYLCRDLDAVLWHCGYWGPGGNDSGYSVHIPGGDQLNLTPEGLAGLTEVVTALSDQDGIPTNMVRGHQEVSPTGCPGPLMDQFVKPFRAGAVPTPTPPPTPPPPAPSPDDAVGPLPGQPETLEGVVVGGAFRRRWLANPNALLDFGWATDNERQAIVTDANKSSQQRDIQVYERCIRIFQPEFQGTEWEVVSARIDQLIEFV